MRLSNLAVLGIITNCFFATSAWAEGANLDENTTLYLDRIVEGHRLVLNNEHDAAIRAYRAALEAVPGDSQATFLIGCAYRASGDLQAALDSFQDVVARAGTDHAIHARALMNIAFLQELRRELAAAREAWQAYITFAEAHQDLTTYVANARQRIAAITAMEELEAAYVPVRQRIAERAASAPSSGQ